MILHRPKSGSNPAWTFSSSGTQANRAHRRAIVGTQTWDGVMGTGPRSDHFGEQND